MIKFLPMVLKNVARNRTRTLLTVGVTLLGTALLFSFLSVERSLQSTLEKTGEGGHVVVQEEYRR